MTTWITICDTCKREGWDEGDMATADTLGGFDPEPEAASGIVAYAMAHAGSETGQVPYREWPQAIKGHFVTRHPPLPEDE